MMIASASLAAYFARWLALRAICLLVWQGYTTPDANEIAESIATAVLEEPAPVFGSAEEDASVLAVFALGESGLYRTPRPQSWDARAGVSCGYLQEPCAFVRDRSVLEQTRYWLDLARRGTVLCPENPVAPLSGGCHGAARRLADSRVARVRGMLATLSR